MRLSVRADHARAVDREDNMQVGERRVVDELVVGALQKARIDRHDRREPLLGHARGHRHGMSLGDADVKKAHGILLGKIVQARTVAHCGGDSADRFVIFCELTEFVAEHRGKISLMLARHAHPRVEFADTVIALRLALGGRVALALFRVHMHEHRTVQVLRPFERVGELPHVVSVHGAEVGKAHVLEHRRIRQQRLFDVRFQMMVKIIHRAADRVAVEQITIGFFEFIVRRLRAQKSQMLAHRADIAVDRHAVVVQNHDERLAARARVVKSLVGKTAGERAVADQRQYGIILMLQRPRPRHAERDGDGVGGMSRDKGVMPALARLGKAREAAVLAQRRKLLAPAGQNFMGVALMPHVEHQPVSRRVEHAVDGHRQLDRAEVRGQMPARFRHIFQQKFTQLRT